MDHMRGKARGIERLYLDFDSFFATVEQHFNPSLRGKPVGVVPLDSPNTGCIAISREAKMLGLKSNTSIATARDLIPDMIFVVARHDVYVRLHDRIREAIETCLPISHVRSIDEVVCELLPSEARQGRALADKIKQTLRETFSAVLTCSIGMAPTELLAKIAAERCKPNGFSLIQAEDLPDTLSRMPLRKLPGISNGIEARLTCAGVSDFTGLWRLAPKQARAIWGNVEGERFWNGLHGYHVQRPETKRSMFGHSRMLPPNWRGADKIETCARQLCMSAGRRLRRAGLLATRLTLSFRGGGHRNRGSSRMDSRRWNWEVAFPPARDDHQFLTALSDGLNAAQKTRGFKPRSVSVMLHGLRDEALLTPDLFGVAMASDGTTAQRKDQLKWERVSDVLDMLRAMHGPEVISLGPQSEMPGGYLGAKIAFGRIPDRADFNNAPVADEATHFCSF